MINYNGFYIFHDYIEGMNIHNLSFEGYSKDVMLSCLQTYQRSKYNHYQIGIDGRNFVVDASRMLSR